MTSRTNGEAVQTLVAHLHQRFQQLGYKKQGTYLFAPHPASQEYRRVCTIQEFLYSEANMSNFNLWCCLTHSPGVPGKVVAVFERDADAWPSGSPPVIRLRYPM